jgi:two-component system, cell cycle response regulator DivK
MTKVLVAEDNAVNRELLHELLEMFGYEVAEATNGREALRLVEETTPDIVLLDIGMPELDGFGVIRSLRSNPHYAHLRVLAITAYAMQGDRERILESGFDGYLSKPVNTQSLKAEMERLLKQQPEAAQAAKAGK